MAERYFGKKGADVKRTRNVKLAPKKAQTDRKTVERPPSFLSFDTGVDSQWWRLICLVRMLQATAVSVWSGMVRFILGYIIHCQYSATHAYIGCARSRSGASARASDAAGGMGPTPDAPKAGRQRATEPTEQAIRAGFVMRQIRKGGGIGAAADKCPRPEMQRTSSPSRCVCCQPRH